MRTVDVGIRHKNDLAVTELCDIEILADTASECLNDRDDRDRGVDLVETALFDVEDLTAEGKDRLEFRVASALCGASRGVSLYEVELGERNVSRLTVCKLKAQP